VQFRCFVPSKLADSSAGSETIVACQCVKAIVAMRMITEELGHKQTAAAPMSLDAKAVIDGTAMDRVSQPPRWLAARQAILRQMIADRITRLVKVNTNLHVPGIFTKPMTDPQRFQCLRDSLLGTPP